MIDYKESYSERAKKWIEDNNLKVGDYVKVLRKYENKDDVWRSYWNIRIDETIGKTLRVGLINPTKERIYLELDDILLECPYFLLEKAEPPKPQYVPFESMHEFISAYYKANNEIIVSTESMLSGFGMWLKQKEDSFMYQVISIFSHGIHLGDYVDDTTWAELLEEYEFLNGTPCGKEVK